ncbi:hypothetical protein PV08_09109 [Exophiala spinifera]|uniref:non-specific serine/threonine protein kinase n=1 Tax=Exophiala spinifera TaxID=91928 RepID=A0A0D1YA58_9EURO|nr:uncharacterized protein PV08_09109 [Exophiala spinifera]KIW11836.1 hypothetical protein PV08_09109 [Exophiala spinifera]
MSCSSNDKPKAEEDVFEHLSAPVECVQDYVPGGLHPVHLGDMVGRYKMLRKLGYGGYSTVWLAQDISLINSDTGGYVALKIVRADRDCAKEIQCYDTLRTSSGRHPGASYIMMLLDYFTIQGPNGKHDCLAYEVLGPSIASVVRDSDGMDTTAYLTLPSARKIIYQVLLALDYIHSVGLVHGDIYHGNVLFILRDLSQESSDDLCQPHSQVSADVKRIKGSRQPGDIRRLTLDWPLNELISPKGDVKLSDLGNSFFKHDPPSKPEAPLEYRSPEIILDNRISMAQDCWAFACFAYSLLTNTSLFDLAFLYDENAQNDEHLLQLFSLLGPLPAWLKQSWPRYDVYFNENGQPQKFIVDDDAFSYSELDDLPEEDHQSTPQDTESDGHQQQLDEVLSNRNRLGKPHEFFDPDLYPSIVTLRERKQRKAREDPRSLADFVALYPPLSEKWSFEKHPDMQSAESELALDFLQGLLTYEPDRRPSTKELLQHAWIRTYCASDEQTVQKAEIPPRNKRKRSTKANESESDEM